MIDHSPGVTAGQQVGEPCVDVRQPVAAGYQGIVWDLD
jgi:hypothetical protein